MPDHGGVKVEFCLQLSSKQEASVHFSAALSWLSLSYSSIAGLISSYNKSSCRVASCLMFWQTDEVLKFKAVLATAAHAV